MNNIIKSVRILSKISQLFIFGLLLFIPVEAFAIGITPPTIDLGVITVGETIEKKITVLRTPQEEGDLTIDVKYRGLGVEYLAGEGFVIPANQRLGDFKLSITPSATAYGHYETYIDFYSNSIVTGSEDTLIVNGATAVVKFQVEADQIVDFVLEKFRVLDNYSSWSIMFDVVNNGNVELIPDRIEYALKKKDESWKEEGTVYADKLELIKPGAAATVDEPVAASLSYGQYDLLVHVVYDGQYVLTENLPWTFGNPAVVKTVFENIQQTKPAQDYWWVGGITAVVLIIIIIAIVETRMHAKKKKKAKKHGK